MKVQFAFNHNAQKYMCPGALCCLSTHSTKGSKVASLILAIVAGLILFILVPQIFSKPSRFEIRKEPRSDDEKFAQQFVTGVFYTFISISSLDILLTALLFIGISRKIPVLILPFLIFIGTVLIPLAFILAILVLKLLPGKTGVYLSTFFAVFFIWLFCTVLRCYNYLRDFTNYQPVQALP